jgi:hypothetical protein
MSQLTPSDEKAHEEAIEKIEKAARRLKETWTAFRSVDAIALATIQAQSDQLHRWMLIP